MLYLSVIQKIKIPKLYMNKIVITAIGNDKPGLVKKITSIVNLNNGNIENSKMIKIENQFAIIMDCSLSSDIKKIKDELNTLEDLKVSYKKINNSHILEKSTKTYFIKGSDDQGIINTVSECFTKNSINIIEVDTFIELAPITGSPLFNMRITIEYTIDINLDRINEEISEICKNLNLDVQIL